VLGHRPFAHGAPSEGRTVQNETLDYLVIGGGPAGLQLGQLLQAAGHGYGSWKAEGRRAPSFRTFPRHRRQISINKVHNGTYDTELNCDGLRLPGSPRIRLLFTRYSKRYFPHADDLVRYLADFAEAFRLDILYNTRAVRIRRTEGIHRTDQHQRNTVPGAWSWHGLTLPHTPDIPVSRPPRNYSSCR